MKGGNLSLRKVKSVLALLVTAILLFSVLTAGASAFVAEEGGEMLEQDNELTSYDHEVEDFDDLKKVGTGTDGWDLGDHYVLVDNIQADSTHNFEPIGYNDPFTGTFDGQGYEIEDLYIDRSSGDIGLFGETDGAYITNVGLVDVDVSGSGYGVGGLVGDAGGYGTISNCYVTGEVTNDGGRDTGGLVGRNFPGDIYNSYSTADVTSVGGNGWAGGLVGLHGGYSDGGGDLKNCYATGTVSADDDTIGGLAGRVTRDVDLEDSYSTGEVIWGGGGDSWNVGGLIGDTYDPFGDLDVINSYWNTETSGQSSSSRGEGRTTDEMTHFHDPDDDTFHDYDEDVWNLRDHGLVEDHEGNSGYPALVPNPQGLNVEYESYTVHDYQSVTLSGELERIEGYNEEAEVYFRYREVGASEWQYTSPTYQDYEGQFDETLTGLEEDTTYEFDVLGRVNHDGSNMQDDDGIISDGAYHDTGDWETTGYAHDGDYVHHETPLPLKGTTYGWKRGTYEYYDPGSGNDLRISLREGLQGGPTGSADAISEVSREEIYTPSSGERFEITVIWEPDDYNYDECIEVYVNLENSHPNFQSPDYVFDIDEDKYDQLYFSSYEWGGASGSDSLRMISWELDYEFTYSPFEFTTDPAYYLTVDSTSGGYVDEPGEGTYGPYEEGESVNLEAYSDTGYYFEGWTGDTGDIDDPNSADTSITMYDDYSIEANFLQEFTLTVEEPGGQGTIEVNEYEIPDNDYPYEEVFEEEEDVDIEADPDDGWVFEEWTGDTGQIDDHESAETTITMESDYTISATFLQEFTLTVENPEGQGTIEVDEYEIPDDGYPYEEVFVDGDIVDIEADSDAGWVFEEWTEDTDPIDEPGSAETTITMDDDHTISATFLEEFDLTVQEPTGDGNISVDGDEVAEYEHTDTFVDGDEVELLADPDDGWVFHEWTGNVDTIDDDQSDDTFITMDDDYTISATFLELFVLTVEEPTGEGNISVDGDEITDYEYTETFEHGTEVDLLAEPDGGWVFDRWTGDVDTIDDNESADTFITMDDDHNISAVFLEEFNLTVEEPEGEGSISVNDTEIENYPYEETFIEGDEVDLSVDPAEGWAFEEWTGDVDTIDDVQSNDTFITMDDDHNISAVFLEEFDLTVTQPDGEVTIVVDGTEIDSYPYEETFVNGTEVPLEAIGDEGWVFDEWTGEVDTIDDVQSNDTFITMEGDHTISVTFLEEYVLTVQEPEGDGTISVGGDEVTEYEYTETFEHGTEVDLLAEPDGGWVFDEWTGEVDTIEDDGSASTFITMKGDHTISVTFLEEYVLTVREPEGDGTISVNDDEVTDYEYTETFVDGTDVDLEADPADGWVFDEWTVDVDTIDDVQSSDTFITMEGDHTISVTFLEEYVLTVQGPEGDGTIRVNDDEVTDYPFTETFIDGDEVELLAEPADPWLFGEWTEDVETIDDPQSADTFITMEGDHTISVIFLEGHVLTVEEPEGEGSLAVEGEEITDYSFTELYLSGTEVALSAYPDDGWVFDEWTGDVEDPGEAETSIIMDEDHTISAVFLEEFTLRVEEPEGEGTLTVEDEEITDYSFTAIFVDGDEVNLSADPGENWFFSEWAGEVDTIDDAHSADTSITMEEDYTISATFLKEEFNLTVEKPEGEGTITVEGEEITDYNHTETFEHGTEVELLADPAEGWVFSEWTGDLEGLEDAETSISMDEDHTISAVFLEEYTLTVEEPEGEGTISVEGTEITDYPYTDTFVEGDKVGLRADPAEGWFFSGWKGDHAGEEEEIIITMDEDKSVEARFEEDTYTLNVSVEGEGTVYREPEKEEYDPGEEVELIAVPEDDWYFDEWTGDALRTEEEITITMDGDKEITAHFEEYVSLTVEVEGEGTVEVDPDEEVYEQGVEVNLTAEPDEGWYFIEWTGDVPENEEEEEDITITMDEDKTVTARFDDESYDLTISVMGGGITEPSAGIYTYRAGEEVTIEATADEGWYFDEWIGIAETGEQITLTMDEDKTVTARFEAYEPAYFEVEIVEYNETVGEGEEFVVEYEVLNSGELEDVQDIVLEVDGEEMEVNRDVSLEAGETYEGEFVLELDEAGEYVLEVSSDDTSDQVTVEVKEDEEKEGFLSNYWWVIVLGSVTAIGIATLWLKKKPIVGALLQQQQSVPPPPPPPSQGSSTGGQTGDVGSPGKESYWRQ